MVFDLSPQDAKDTEIKTSDMMVILSNFRIFDSHFNKRTGVIDIAGASLDSRPTAAPSMAVINNCRGSLGEYPIVTYQSQERGYSRFSARPHYYAANLSMPPTSFISPYAVVSVKPLAKVLALPPNSTSSV